MVKHGKRYNNASSQVVEDTDYEPADAVALVKNLATAKFDETIELHLRT
ncbi:MAG TPA: 50S ribosomal protein L1, partial [Dehalococcoidia bacterium]|nr:50S ribosomal protein L1 [Dehalococcoidia bacterium]